MDGWMDTIRFNVRSLTDDGYITASLLVYRMEPN